MILGLTGTLGSGKSTVAGMLRDKGAQVICADEIAREAVAKGTQALQEIVAEFGPEVLAPDGSLNRKALAGRVFNDPQARRALEAIIHPRVRERELELLETYRSAPLIVLDIPLLFESGADALCDAVAVVTVDDAHASNASPQPAAWTQRTPGLASPPRCHRKKKPAAPPTSSTTPAPCNKPNNKLMIS